MSLYTSTEKAKFFSKYKIKKMCVSTKTFWNITNELGTGADAIL